MDEKNNCKIFSASRFEIAKAKVQRITSRNVNDHVIYSQARYRYQGGLVPIFFCGEPFQRDECKQNFKKSDKLQKYKKHQKLQLLLVCCSRKKKISQKTSDADLSDIENCRLKAALRESPSEPASARVSRLFLPERHTVSDETHYTLFVEAVGQSLSSFQVFFHI